VAIAFYNGGPLRGTIFLVCVMVLLPIVLAAALKYWPNTPIGRRFLLTVPSDDDALPHDQKSERQKSLVGKFGVAKSKMLPSGAVVIEGTTVDAVSQGMAIDAGQRVVVLEVRGNRVVVRPAKEQEQLRSETGDDLLSQPLDALGIESLDDPLA
jgi:membrane-bound serine protease (ClpP class)